MVGQCDPEVNDVSGRSPCILSHHIYLCIFGVGAALPKQTTQFVAEMASKGLDGHELCVSFLDLVVTIGRDARGPIYTSPSSDAFARVPPVSGSGMQNDDVHTELV